MTVFNGDDPADCQPTCTKCGHPVPIRSIREDGWIDLEPHVCGNTVKCIHCGWETCWSDVPCTSCGRPPLKGSVHEVLP